MWRWSALAASVLRSWSPGSVPHCDTPRSRLHRLDVPPSDRIPEGGQVLNALSESCRKWGVLLPLNSLHELNQPTERPPGLGLCLTWTGLRCTQRPRCGGSTCGNSSQPPRVLRRALPSDVFPRRPLAFPRCPLLCLVSGWLAGSGCCSSCAWYPAPN